MTIGQRVWIIGNGGTERYVGLVGHITTHLDMDQMCVKLEGGGGAIVCERDVVPVAEGARRG